MSDFSEVATWAEGFLAKLEPGQRALLAKSIARELRQSQQQRIAAQRNPDGSGYTPRKPQLRSKIGKIKRGAMFKKLRSSSYMTMKSSSSGAFIEFAGRVSRIASVHQHGLRDIVNRARPVLQVDYPARELLGFSSEDHERIKDQILTFLSD